MCSVVGEAAAVQAVPCCLSSVALCCTACRAVSLFGGKQRSLLQAGLCSMLAAVPGWPVLWLL